MSPCVSDGVTDNCPLQANPDVECLDPAGCCSAAEGQYWQVDSDCDGDGDACDPDACQNAGHCDDGIECTVDECAPTDPQHGADGCVHEDHERPFGDVAHPYADETAAAQPDLDDILCVLAAFEAGGGWQSVCALADLLTDVNTCEPNAIVDLDDILAVLSAFESNPVCPASCP